MSVILQQCLYILGVVLSVQNDSGPALVCRENSNSLIPAVEKAAQGYPSGSVEAAGPHTYMLHRSICRAFARECGRNLLPHCTFVLPVHVRIHIIGTSGLYSL